MKWLKGYRIKLVLIRIVIALFALNPVAIQAQNGMPVADAGLSRYAGPDPVTLDGTRSYDPDNSGPLSYTWRQISGTSVVIIDANTATPTIAGSMKPGTGRDPTPKPEGFLQTDEVQECEFELVVSDGKLTSLPDRVKILIVPEFGENMLRLANNSFNPDKPTYVFFQGGDGIVGQPFQVAWASVWPDWLNKTNIIDFPGGYVPDIGGDPRTYYDCGDMIIVYLSSVAPDYRMPIQTVGISTGGQPAIDVGIHLNLTYQDARYAVNHVTFFDATGYNRNYSQSISTFLTSSVDGEQCWIDNYVGTLADAHPLLQYPSFHPNVLNVLFDKAADSSLPYLYRHELPAYWYSNSLTGDDMNRFNNGIVAGAYWSVAGPGKNIELASTPGVETYKFIWYGDEHGGFMDFYDEPKHPGRLPEPVTLVGPLDGTFVDTNGSLLSCKESENAVGYQLLFGPDPYHMVYLFSDTPSPPGEPVRAFPFEQTWWTVRAYDLYGSTIHADPMYIHAESVVIQPIENAGTGQTYASIQQAINDAHSGDEIIVSSGACQYCENITFKGKNLTVRSTDPTNPAVVAATVINGGYRHSAVAFSGSEDSSCVLDGFAITGGAVGISCRNAIPTIRNCKIGSNGPVAIEFWHGYGPEVIDSTVSGHIEERNDPRLAAHWKLDETEGDVAYDSAAENDAAILGSGTWEPENGRIDGTLNFDGIDDYILTPRILNPADAPFSVFVWIKGGAPGQVVISQVNGADWLLTDSHGCLMTDLKSSSRRSGDPLISEVVITDGIWHRIGFVWDGSFRCLHVDGVKVARDLTPLSGLKGSDGGLYFGVGSTLNLGTFYYGLIDDIRIYNRIISP